MTSHRRLTPLGRTAPQWRASLITLLLLAFLVTSAQAQTSASPPKADSGDTAWMLVSIAFVMLMTPGLALFYGGMVKTKNVLNMLLQSFVALGIVTIVWVLWGYSLAFSPGSAILGGLSWLGLHGVGEVPNPDYSATIPHTVFMMYQMMFAIITPALISGAIAERMKFSTYVVFMVLWSTLVYCPLAHWVWGKGGWLGASGVGALDFAGGTVVHISSGIAALVLCIFLGRRQSSQPGRSEEIHPHSLPMTLIGTALLWFGWFGFNAGSALASSGQAGSALMVTHIAAAAGGFTWTLIEWNKFKRPTALGFATGAVAGLVAITPASGFVGPMPALAIGIAVSFISFNAIKLKHRFRYDDTLDVFGVHGIGGIWGAIATGLFASAGVDPKNYGLFFGGGFAPVLKQAIAVGTAVGYSALVTVLIVLVLRETMGLRVTPEEETAGMDLTQHGEAAYGDLESESNPML